MSINLIALLTVLLVQVMITVILNSLWRMLKKTGFFLKALLLQVPLFRGTFLQMKELEETAARRKADRKRIPEQRQPTLEMDPETETGKQNPVTANPGQERNPGQNQNQKQNQGQKQNQKQRQRQSRNPIQNPEQ